MSFVKSVMGGAWDFDVPFIQLVKRSSRGLIGRDKAAFEKRASADILRSVDDLMQKLASDDVLVHLLAIGATEDYGANRNGDGFRRKVCRDYHDTFEKHAHFYRNHQNKDPLKSYGRVIKSAFHDPMKRIELLVRLNGSPESAKRHNGLFADRELEKLAAGRDIPVSMACKVAYDICSYCGNRAPRPDDYCRGTDEGGHCKAGGLKNRMGSLVEIDGGIHQLHADNPHPLFFDISHVFRPADRIAYVMGQLEKAASDRNTFIKSADLAAVLGISIPCELMIDASMPPRTQELIKLAHVLARIEESVTTDWVVKYAAAVAPAVQFSESPFPTPPVFQEKFAMAMRALADARICLTPARFIEAVTSHGMEKAAEIGEVISRELPGIYTRMVADPCLADRLARNPYTPSECVAPPQFQTWAVKQASMLSLSEPVAHRRVIRAALNLADTVELRSQLGLEKVASVTEPIGKLAEEYALYKLAFLGALPKDDDFQLTASLAILQNYVK